MAGDRVSGHPGVVHCRNAEAEDYTTDPGRQVASDQDREGQAAADQHDGENQ